ncbi:MAG: Rieske 2Fe-2S domain-containing protein [Candidatus Omnitrophota bacterium]|nr:Rieske 2Fe-2S domain-containing protein [Candidatus Omnitrophota bacterium]
MNTTEQTKWYLISETHLFPEREGKRVHFKDYDIAVFNLGNGRFRAIDNTCPHKQGPLADGIVAGENVFCPLHALKIDLGSGCAVEANGKVRSYPVQVYNAKVYVAFDEGE